MEKDNDDYAPCFKLLKATITNEVDMPIGGRLFVGFLGLVGTFTIDPSIWIINKLGIVETNHDADPNDAGGFL